MKSKISPAVVGAFVLGALALAVVGLLSFGGVDLFVKPQRFVVYFYESVHGLDLGSPVKLRGVRIGRVVDLHVRYDEKTHQPVAEVDCELNRNTIRDAAGTDFNLAVEGRLQAMVDSGLRAQLDVAGLATGLLFVELDFQDPKAYPATPPPGPSPYVFVPSVPSAISEFQANVSEILGHIHQVDFQGLSNNLIALLADARQKLDGLDLKGVADQWRETGAAVESVARSPEIPKMFANANSALLELKSAIATLDSQVGTNGRNLDATLAQTRDAVREIQSAAATLKSFILAEQDVGSNIDTAFVHLSDAADSVQRLADFLERNPNALITGRPTPQ